MFYIYVELEYAHAHSGDYKFKVVSIIIPRIFLEQRTYCTHVCVCVGLEFACWHICDDGRNGTLACVCVLASLRTRRPFRWCLHINVRLDMLLLPARTRVRIK